MANKPCDLLDAMPSSDSSETNVCRKSRGARSLPNPALSQTSWNNFQMCLAPSGVPVAVVNTLSVSCQRDPAASRSGAWSTCYARSAGTCTGGSLLWLPGFRLAFQKGHLAANTRWAQSDLNLRTPRL
jgi:hypothetical protein